MEQQSLTPQERMRFGIIAIVFIILGMCIYEFIQYITVPRYDLETSWDRALPFIPAMIFIYIAYFPFIVMTGYWIEKRDFYPLIWVATCTCVISWTIFLIMPAAIDRPSPDSISNGILRFIFVVVHWVDGPLNTFPSLHVGISWCCGFYFFNTPRAKYMMPCAFLISISTVLVKQHFVVDVIGGFMVALFSSSVVWYIVAKKRQKFSKMV